MNFNDKIKRQFRDLRLKAPLEPLDVEHIYADYIELIAVFSNDCYVTSADILDRLQDEGKIDIKDTNNAIQVGSIAAEQHDIYEAWINEIFYVIQQRAFLFGAEYPFDFDNRKIRIKNPLTSKQKLYVALLVSSNLHLFNKVKSILTKEFEIISFYALKTFLPDHAIVKSFGKSTDYQGNAKDKIRRLAVDLNVDVDEYEIKNISRRNNQERGLDLVGWIPFNDGCPNSITILGQCTCGKDWPSKHHDTRRFVHYLKFYRIKPIHAMFISYSLINHGKSKFYRSDDIEDDTLVFERKRIIEYFKNEKEFLNLKSNRIVEECIKYQEDVV